MSKITKNLLLAVFFFFFLIKFHSHTISSISTKPKRIAGKSSKLVKKNLFGMDHKQI